MTLWPDSWTPGDVVRWLEPLVRPERRRRLLDVIGRRLGSVTVVMDAPHDPHNASAILRTCDALGIPEIHVIPRDEPPLIGRGVAKGSERWVSARIHASVEDAVRRLREQGFFLVATHPKGRMLPEDLAKVPRLALILGNEHDGVRASLEQAADASARIPMRGFVESLNVSVAAAVLLASATRDRPGDLAPSARERLYAEGLFLSVPRASDVLGELAQRGASAER
ncbi:MAG TPA: RNA methyltransferase [Polyangiaceae bacterium]